MKRVHLYFALLAMTVFVVSSFALQGRGQGRRPAGAGTSSIPVISAKPSSNPGGNPGGGNPGGGNPGGGNPGGGNPGGGNPGGGNPGGGNPGGGNPGGGNPGGGNPGGGNPGGGNPGGGNPGGGNPGGGGNRGGGNPGGGGNRGGGNPGGGNPGGNASPTRDAHGFKNYGQYQAAQHVSENLGISFDALKTKMTGSNAISLGKAIQQLRPELSAGAAQAAAKRAEQASKNQGKKK